MADERRGVLEGAFLVLEALAATGDAGLTRIAVAAGLPKSTTHRLLDQLVGLGAVRRRNGRYRIGSRMFRLGQGWRPASALRAAAHHPLRQLAVATRSPSVAVVLPEAEHMVVVTGIVGEMDDAPMLQAGAVLPRGHAAGIVLAADTPDATPPGEYSAREWARLSKGVREQGVAFHDVAPVGCMAAPVRAPSGEIVAVVGAGVLDTGRLGSLTSALHRAAGMISANLAKAGPALV